ncbi:hypothetical protein [Vibrio phage Va-ZX-1]
MSCTDWCLQKALERTLAGDKEGSLEYLELAKLWYKREVEE